MKNTPTNADQRAEILNALRNLKMARSAHSYVRGNTRRFYQWLADLPERSIPEGPPVWICGDCHMGNIGPVASVSGDVQLQIRDVDQTVIGNPTHDLIRLGLSLAMAARGSDLPGVTTALMMERLVEGYTGAMAMELGLGAAEGDTPQVLPAPVHLVMDVAARRSWAELARERLEDGVTRLPIGRRFWKLTRPEKDAIARLFEKRSVSRLATLLSSRPDDMPVEVVDAAYWVKGCSSLGRLRYAVILAVGQGRRGTQYCLIDIKEAVPAAAPAYPGHNMPVHLARRVVEGARNLSPHLGERMLATDLMGKPVFLRELLPQDLKLEIATLSAEDAQQVAAHLAGVVGKAHARQMDAQTARRWMSDLGKNHSKTLGAPSWLWKSVVDLVASHEAGYLEHCRRYALGQEGVE